MKQKRNKKPLCDGLTYKLNGNFAYHRSFFAPVSPRVNYLSLVSVTLFKMLGTAFRCYVDKKVIIDCEKNNMLIYICVSISRLTSNTS